MELGMLASPKMATLLKKKSTKNRVLFLSLVQAWSRADAQREEHHPPPPDLQEVPREDLRRQGQGKFKKKSPATSSSALDK